MGEVSPGLDCGACLWAQDPRLSCPSCVPESLKYNSPWSKEGAGVDWNKKPGFGGEWESPRGKRGGGWRSRSKGRGRSGQGGSHVGVSPRARGCERPPLRVGVTWVRRRGGLLGAGTVRPVVVVRGGGRSVESGNCDRRGEPGAGRGSHSPCGPLSAPPPLAGREAGGTRGPP